MAVMDACNVRWGRGVVPGTAGLASSRKDSSTKFEMEGRWRMATAVNDIA
ncbi:hypothetical protein [Methylobacterium iners]|uniref:DUF4113 domain-containing protein n=1 Tax=Methylobacterium iners TaxID=418707 RepID=A0ABQ4RUR9_9HYPH|nr:hypothetical protein [Methylobacterium iners]GJD93949.1 hypothetical protein OCOJLMKI_1147 [Methylobacterium iners]